jgi:hypothetical protein
LRLLVIFLCLCCNRSRSQDLTCCKPEKKDAIEKELISLKKDLGLQTEIKKNGIYQIRFKEIKGMIQGSPRGPWLGDTCIQKYNAGDPVSIKKIKSKIENDFLPSNTNLQFGFYENYLVVYFYKRIEGSQTSWAGWFTFYYERLDGEL